MRDKGEVTPNRLVSAVWGNKQLCWVVSWELVAINLNRYFIGGLFSFGG